MVGAQFLSTLVRSFALGTRCAEGEALDTDDLALTTATFRSGAEKVAVVITRLDHRVSTKRYAKAARDPWLETRRLLVSGQVRSGCVGVLCGELRRYGLARGSDIVTVMATVNVTVSLSDDVAALAKQTAREEGTTVSGWVAGLIREATMARAARRYLEWDRQSGSEMAAWDRAAEGTRALAGAEW